MIASGSSWWRSCARGGAVAACYEAGVSGYDLYRQITTSGVVYLPRPERPPRHGSAERAE